MKLRFRGPSQSGIVSLDVPDELPVSALPMIVEDAFNISADRVVLAHGFPPKPVDPGLADRPVSQCFKEGDMFIVREGEATLKRGRTDGKYIPPCDERSVMQTVPVPADNSCLFHAVAKVSEQPGLDATTLRQRCVEVVLAHPTKFNATLLGQRTEDYALWLAQPDAWGGMVELIILSFVLQMEIVVIDQQSSRLETIGRDENFVTRGFVIYTGKHYDAVAMVSTMKNTRQFLFNTRDERPLNCARSLVAHKGE